MSDNNKLVYSIIKFLKDQLNSSTPEACESIEVAIQCLENAYEIHSDEAGLDTGVPLAKLFADHIAKSKRVATQEEKEEAERLKIEGNTFVKAEKFKEAVDCYTRAIELDSNNPVYYCNRAAAYSRLENHQATIEDCKAALKIDPTYSKAYGRLGVGYTSLHMYEEAKESYQKALELEPDNESYKTNLALNEALQNSRAGVNGVPNRLPNVDFDLNALLGNPSIMSMATQMLSDPTMQNMMSSLMSGNVNENSSGMDALIRAGQRLAQHMQSANPDLVEQLRQQMTDAGTDPQNRRPKTD